MRPLPRIAFVAASLIGLAVLGAVGVWLVRSPAPSPGCAGTSSRRTDADNRYGTIARTRAGAEAEGYVQGMQQLSGDGRCARRNLHHGLAGKRA